MTETRPQPRPPRTTELPHDGTPPVLDEEEPAAPPAEADVPDDALPVDEEELDDALPIEENFPAAGRGETEQNAGEFGAAGAHESG